MLTFIIALIGAGIGYLAGDGATDPIVLIQFLIVGLAFGAAARQTKPFRTPPRRRIR